MINLNSGIISFTAPNTNKHALLNNNFKVTDSTKSPINKIKTQQNSIDIQNSKMIESISMAMSKQIGESIIASAKNNSRFISANINSVSIDKIIKSNANNIKQYGTLVKTPAVIEQIKSTVRIKVRDMLMEELNKKNISNDQISAIKPSAGFIT